ncbi:alpha/beta hydrolase family protein [Pontibacter beigongshangensis]|uniref:alpha/beta hydrolase family protein n=1 Tax=Pontibacter beigongshangensis TaxID=2574733 RepID=UPI001F506B2C|nr:prolyl oligopeptidase family serine peptidase [Pontibacter beigongshangensis]
MKILFYRALCLLLLFYMVSCSGERKENSRSTAPKEPPRYSERGYTTSKAYPATFAEEDFEAWQQEIPQVRKVDITSTADGKVEPALFYDSGTQEKKPLLVVLHSWSSEYLQEVSIPYAEWAKEKDWVFIHPNFRGAFEKPEATASELAVQDIVDAVNFAKENAEIDTSRIYLVGSSGGALTALVVAGRHPDIWAGVVAWVPILDLTEWYTFNLYYPNRKYNQQIEASCGGKPEPGNEADKECKKRSPITYLENARNIPIFLAHALTDVLVPSSHSIRAYNMLAAPQDTIPQQQINHIEKEQVLPEEMQGFNNDPYFGPTDPAVLFTKESANVKLVLFDGVHDMAYNPTLLWLSEQQQKTPGSPTNSAL